MNANDSFGEVNMDCLKLNLGSGKRKLIGYVNIDFDPSQAPDKLWDLEKGLPWLADNSVEIIYSSHLLEHVHPEKYHFLLEEMYRVSRDGARWTLHLPIDNARNRADQLHFRTYWWGCWACYAPSSNRKQGKISLFDHTLRISKLAQLWWSIFSLAKREICFELEVFKDEEAAP